jgi:hypothetical protein
MAAGVMAPCPGLVEAVGAIDVRDAEDYGQQRLEIVAVERG